MRKTVLKLAAMASLSLAATPALAGEYINTIVGSSTVPRQHQWHRFEVVI